MEELRTIITSYMVISDKGPLALGNKDEAQKWLKMAEEKGMKARIREITTNTERLQELGRNLFEIELPKGIPLLEFRNELVSRMTKKCEQMGLDSNDCDISRVWSKIANEYNLQITFDEFHRCVMDKMEYGTY